MSRALLVAALLALACGNNVPASPLGEFTSPMGLAATGAGDRDVLFVANSGRDGLRALQLCNRALLLDGGVDPADTCPQNENGQFVPAPIRVFPATIETGGRPLRVAGVRLSRADGSAAGVALAPGARPVDADGGVADAGAADLAIVDARSLVEAQKDPGAVPKPIQHLDVGGRVIDVVAANPMHDDLDIEIAPDAGVTVPAFVATETELVVLDVGLDPGGSAQLPSIRARCSLAPVVPTKIAVVPGGADQVYVADGKGDGVVAIATGSISNAGGPCTMDRISAGGRTVRSVSVSPKWYEAVPGPPGGPDVQVSHAAGELLVMVVDPLPVPEPGKELDRGGVLLARTGLGGGPKGLVPIPPFDLTDATAERMQPLTLPFFGVMREATFLRSVKPRPSPVPPDLSTCTGAPCTPLYVGLPTNAPVHRFNLLAAASGTDGATYFIDVPNRRFVNQNLYAQDNDAALLPTLDPGTIDASGHPIFSPAVANAPVMTVDISAVEPGVTRQAAWRALYHSPIPGLDRRGGTLRPTGAGTLKFTSPPANFAIWQNDPVIKLAAGDVVSLSGFALAGDASAACQTVVSTETSFRFELPILAITADTLELGELPDTPAQIGFHPDSCSALGAVAEVRTGGTQPWLVFNASTAVGRVEPDGSFVARQRRFDYPRTKYSPGDATTPPQAAKANDVAFKFSIAGTPPAGKSGFTWGMRSGQAFTQYSDAVAVSGLATAIYAYSSPRSQSLVFTSITGSNEVLQADPALLASNLTAGIKAYR